MSCPHNGNPQKIVRELISQNYSHNITVTGRQMRNMLNLTSISEPEAVELAFSSGEGSQNIVIFDVGLNINALQIPVYGV